MNRTTDPQTFSSAGNARDRILNAFVALLAERGYEALRVADILAKSGVGRTSFYLHFANKEALSRDSVARLKSGLIHATAAERLELTAGPLAFSRAFFRHLDGHRSIYHAVVGREDFGVMSHHLRRMLLELVRDDVARAQLHRGDAVATEFAAQHVAGALWAVATWWLEQAAALSPDAVDARFRALALRGLRAGEPEFRREEYSPPRESNPPRQPS